MGDYNMIKGDKFVINTYEYKTIHHIPDDKELETLGNEGWELCCILATEFNMTYYFKRKCGELMTIREC